MLRFVLAFEKRSVKRGGVSIAVPPSPRTTHSETGLPQVDLYSNFGGVILRESAGFPNIKGPP